MMTEREFGIMCLKMMCMVLAPILLAASTYSWFFRLMIWPRTILAMVSQDTMASARKRFMMFLPKIAMHMITRSMYGSPYMMSTKRIR